MPKGELSTSKSLQPLRWRGPFFGPRLVAPGTVASADSGSRTAVIAGRRLRRRLANLTPLPFQPAALDPLQKSHKRECKTGNGELPGITPGVIVPADATQLCLQRNRTAVQR